VTGSNGRPEPGSPPGDAIRAMADISQLGLDAAAAVVERVLELSRSAASLRLPLLPAAPNTTEGSQLRNLRADVDRIIELYADWTRGLADSLIDAAESSRAGMNGHGRPDCLLLGPAGPGDEAAGQVWLHTHDGPAARPGAVVATDLTAHHGAVVGAANLRFDPPVVDVAPPRTSVALTVRVAVPMGTPPGPYVGHILVRGLPEIGLPVQLDVAESDGP
jgi:hypothetical protein